ncbi:hypothetical protein RP20_CCG026746 [Aedes albopictus]|nr:hypothetical protein RP20_CCG026746 [Aedes albopictus]
MSVQRKNTIVVDFGILPTRPEIAKIQQFLEKDIQLQLSDVENIQLHHIRGCVLIEVKDSDTAIRYQQLHNNRHIIMHGDKAFRIPVYVENEAVPVRVLDLPPAMKHTTVIDFLTQYGKVQSVTRERWKNFFPGVYNGVRILHMKIERPIPSYVTIEGHETSISYPGMQKTCRQCNQPAHPKQKCSGTPNNIITSSKTPTNTAPSSVPANSEDRFSLNVDDFPPISAQQKQQRQRQQTNNNKQDRKAFLRRRSTTNDGEQQNRTTRTRTATAHLLAQSNPPTSGG